MHIAGTDDSKKDIDVDSLVDRAVRGDTEAFGRLYDMYADNVYRHIYYRTTSVEDARDLTQDVFAKAWENLPRYRRTATPFLGWLFTISHNRVIDYYRTKKTHKYIDSDLAPGSGGSPEESAEASLTQDRIRQAILQLSGDQQHAALLCLVEGLDHKEVAAVMGKSEGNVRVIVHRALKRMREILGSQEV